MYNVIIIYDCRLYSSWHMYCKQLSSCAASRQVTALTQSLAYIDPCQCNGYQTERSNKIDMGKRHSIQVYISTYHDNSPFVSRVCSIVWYCMSMLHLINNRKVKGIVVPKLVLHTVLLILNRFQNVAIVTALLSQYSTYCYIQDTIRVKY